MNELQVFTKNDFQVRTIEDNSEIYFVAKDVAQALGYSEASLASMNKLCASVPEQWKGQKPFPTLGGVQEMLCLTEQGLYFFLGRSDKPKALPYQMWIAGEVIPSIRRHGAYMTEKTLTNPNFTVKRRRSVSKAYLFYSYTFKL